MYRRSVACRNSSPLQSLRGLMTKAPVVRPGDDCEASTTGFRRRDQSSLQERTLGKVDGEPLRTIRNDRKLPTRRMHN